MNADLQNWKKEKVGTLELPDDLFGVKWNPVLVNQALLAQLANKRSPWAHVKFRGEVRGGGKKPWRQKGTGRARHGSTRSPLWVGGGKSHGPRNEKDYSQKLNRKMRRLALLSVLSKKHKDGEIVFLESMVIPAPKTKELVTSLKPFVIPRTKKWDMLFIPPVDNKNIGKAARNLPKAKAVSPESLNVYDLLNYKRIFMDKDTVEAIRAKFTAK